MAKYITRIHLTASELWYKNFGTWSKCLGHSILWEVIYYPCPTVYPKKCAHGFVVLCFVVVMQSFIMNSHLFIHIHQGCFAGTGAIVRFPQCQWSKPDGYGKINQCITTTKHSKAKTVCIFLGIYCRCLLPALKSSYNHINTKYIKACAYFTGCIS